MLNYIKYNPFIDDFFTRLEKHLKGGPNLLPTCKEGMLKDCWHIIRDLNKLLKTFKEKPDKINTQISAKKKIDGIHLTHYVDHSALLTIDIKAKLKQVKLIRDAIKSLPDDKFRYEERYYK